MELTLFLIEILRNYVTQYSIIVKITISTRKFTKLERKFVYNRETSNELLKNSLDVTTVWREMMNFENKLGIFPEHLTPQDVRINKYQYFAAKIGE